MIEAAFQRLFYFLFTRLKSGKATHAAAFPELVVIKVLQSIQ